MGAASEKIRMEVSTKGQFALNFIETASNKVLLSTAEQSFIMMNHYMEIGFKVKADKLFGMGERVGEFLL